VAGKRPRPSRLAVDAPAPWGGVPPTSRHYFENSPDNRLIRERLQARFHTRSTSAQDLLAEVGRDCVGALAILPEGESPEGYDRIEGVPLTEKQIEQALGQVTVDARHADEDHFRISIAGAQEKTAFLWHEGRWMRPTGATPTTHIFKLPLGVPPSGIDLRQASRTNGSALESWLLMVCRSRGDIARFGERTVLVVPRFDRQLASDGTWLLRLPQEDFAQVCVCRSRCKVRVRRRNWHQDRSRSSARAPRRRKETARTSSDPVLFWMLAAIDGHAKNFSVFIEPRVHFRLTPRYDVLSAYPVLGHGRGKLAAEKVKMAMAVWGDNRHYKWREIRRAHFEKTAKDCGLGSSVQALIDELVERSPEVIAQVTAALPPGFPEAVSASILDGLAQAAQRLK
jgi:serine/threonine-protein kinase HipA